jgi:hypothetical protein
MVLEWMWTLALFLVVWSTVAGTFLLLSVAVSKVAELTPSQSLHGGAVALGFCIALAIMAMLFDLPLPT